MNNTIRSKLVVVFYPREKKMTKAQIAKEIAVNACMSMMSTVDHRGPKAALMNFGFDPADPQGGLPAEWFGSERLAESVSLHRAMDSNGYNTLFHWCQSEGVPAARGELDGEGTCWEIGPYWSEKIDELLERAFVKETSLRDFE